MSWLGLGSLGERLAEVRLGLGALSRLSGSLNRYQPIVEPERTGGTKRGREEGQDR